jgi:hypothetical protein
VESNLAVLIDFENIAAGTEKEGLGRFDVEAVLQRIKDKGRVLVARSYADWGRFARFKQSLLTNNVTMYELTSHGMHDKNRADIAMVVDALDLAFTKSYIDTFVVVSGDSDFTPLVLKMRELNKKVIGCGTRSSTSRLLIQACDEFIFYDTIVETTRRTRQLAKTRAEAPTSPEAAFTILAEALVGLLREGGDPPHGSVVKGAMLRKMPDFSETDYGFGTFTRFLEEADRAGVVKIVRDQKAGGYRVEPAEGTDEPREVDVDPVPRPEGPWVDPSCPTGMEWAFHLLDQEGYNPMAAPARLATLAALVEVVAEREKKKRRNNIQFVREDVRRKLKKAFPDVPARAVRSVFDALVNVNAFIHRDGTAVRTGSASFELKKDAGQLNRALTNLYLETMRTLGGDLSNTDGLALLFLGDTNRRKEIEEMVAWLDSGGDDAESEPTGPSALDTDVDFDDLLEVGATEEIVVPAPKKAAAVAAPPKAEPAPKAAAKAPKASTASKPAAKAPAAAPTAEEADLDALLSDDGPAAAPAASADDDLLVEEPGTEPTRKPRRRRARGPKAGGGDSAPE